MGNGRSSPVTSSNAWRKKSLSTNSSPVHRKISTLHRLEVYAPLEALEDQHLHARTPSPSGGKRKSVELALSPRQVEFVYFFKVCNFGGAPPFPASAPASFSKSLYKTDCSQSRVS